MSGGEPSQPVMSGDPQFIIANATSVRDACDDHVAWLQGELSYIETQTSPGGAVTGPAGTACFQSAEAIVDNDYKVLNRIIDRSGAQVTYAENNEQQEAEAEAAITAVANAIAAQ